jgi:hypothetical protein
MEYTVFFVEKDKQPVLELREPAPIPIPDVGTRIHLIGNGKRVAGDFEIRGIQRTYTEQGVDATIEVVRVAVPG